MAEEKKDKKETKKKHAGHGYKSTHITHHADGSHTVKHEHEDGASHQEYAKPDLDGVHDGLQDHMGVPNPGEAESEAGESGIPEAAPAAAAPAAGGAGPTGA
jgi:hypothetical protein